MQSDRDDFIGKKFGEVGQLEVIGRELEIRSGQRYYILKCLVCAMDPEMFGEGLFASVKGNLLKGFIPCNCGKIFQHTSKQTALRIQRYCDNNNKPYTFIDYTEDYKGKDTKVVMLCKLCDKTWNTTTSNCILRGTGCPSCKFRNNGLRSQKKDSVMIESFFKSGAFKEGTSFTKSERLTKAGCKSFWNMHCPICSVDEYVQANVCSGIFESFSGSFQTGMLPCRCSKSYYYTRSQREYKIKEILKRESDGISFTGWSEEKWKWTRAKFELNCPTHGNFTRDVNSFINGENYSCPSCAKYGFNKHKPAHLYVFRADPIIQDGITPSFTGYGISNSLESRFVKHERNILVKGFKITRPCIYLMDGLDAQLLESQIKKHFPLYSQDIEGFKTEATYGYLYKYVRYYIDDNLPESYIDGTEDYDGIG